MRLLPYIVYGNFGRTARPQPGLPDRAQFLFPGGANQQAVLLTTSYTIYFDQMCIVLFPGIARLKLMKSMSGVQNGWQVEIEPRFQGRRACTPLSGFCFT